MANTSEIKGYPLYYALVKRADEQLLTEGDRQLLAAASSDYNDADFSASDLMHAVRSDQFLPSFGFSAPNRINNFLLHRTRDLLAERVVAFAERFRGQTVKMYDSGPNSNVSKLILFDLELFISQSVPGFSWKFDSSDEYSAQAEGYLGPASEARVPDFTVRIDERYGIPLGYGSNALTITYHYGRDGSQSQRKLVLHLPMELEEQLSGYLYMFGDEEPVILDERSNGVSRRFFYAGEGREQAVVSQSSSPGEVLRYFKRYAQHAMAVECWAGSHAFTLRAPDQAAVRDEFLSSAEDEDQTMTLDGSNYRLMIDNHGGENLYSALIFGGLDRQDPVVAELIDAYYSVLILPTASRRFELPVIHRNSSEFLDTQEDWVFEEFADSYQFLLSMLHLAKNKQDLQKEVVLSGGVKSSLDKIMAAVHEVYTNWDGEMGMRGKRGELTVDIDTVMVADDGRFVMDRHGILHAPQMLMAYRLKAGLPLTPLKDQFLAKELSWPLDDFTLVCHRVESLSLFLELPRGKIRWRPEDKRQIQAWMGRVKEYLLQVPSSQLSAELSHLVANVDALSRELD